MSRVQIHAISDAAIDNEFGSNVLSKTKWYNMVLDQVAYSFGATGKTSSTLSEEKNIWTMSIFIANLRLCNQNKLCFHFFYINILFPSYLRAYKSIT